MREPLTKRTVTEIYSDVNDNFIQSEFFFFLFLLMYVLEAGLNSPVVHVKKGIKCVQLLSFHIDMQMLDQSNVPNRTLSKYTHRSNL